MFKRLSLPLLLVLSLSLPARAADKTPSDRPAAEQPRPPLKAGKVPLPPRSGAARPAPRPMDRSFLNQSTLNGMWRADVKRTADLFGDDAAAGPAKDPNIRLEFDITGKHYRVWQDAKKTKSLVDIPLQSVEMKGSTVVLTAEGKPLQVEIIDADSLILLDKDVVIVRVKPGE